MGSSLGQGHVASDGRGIDSEQDVRITPALVRPCYAKYFILEYDAIFMLLI